MGSIGENSMNVPIEKWGTFLNGADMQMLRDENGTIIGNIQDHYRWETEPVHRTITKKEALNDLEGWKNDDGTYGTGDEAIYIAYNDGRFLNLTDGDEHKRWSKQGIAGISISTGDYEMVWGGELNKRTGQIESYTTYEFDSNANPIAGYKNSYSGYRTTAEWYERVKEVYGFDEKRGRGTVTRTVLRRSTKRPVGRS